MNNRNFFEWTRENMNNIYLLSDRVDKKVFQTRRLYINIPLTWETLVLIEVLKNLGTDLIVVPLSSGENGSLKKETVPILKKWGVEVFEDATEENRIRALKLQPEFIFDCIGYATETGLHHNLLQSVKGYLELTRTGVLKFQEWVIHGKITKPVIPIDEIPIKRRGEDLYGSGLALLRVLLDLNIYLPTKKVTVIGFGPIGQSCSRRLKDLGCQVNVIELDKLKQLWAKFEAYQSPDLEDVISSSDIIVTATGILNILGEKDFDLLKDGTILVNMGAQPNEWDHDLLKVKSVERDEVFTGVTRYHYKGNKRIFELAGSNSANLVIGEFATPFEVMDLTFSAAIKGMEYLFANHESLSGMVELPQKELESVLVKPL